MPLVLASTQLVVFLTAIINCFGAEWAMRARKGGEHVPQGKAWELILPSEVWIQVALGSPAAQVLTTSTETLFTTPL